MSCVFALALAFLPASFGFAAAAIDTPAPQLLTLEKELAREQEAKGPDRPTPARYKEFAAKFRATLDATMARVAPTAANRSVHARILARLGDSSRALADLNGALKNDPGNPRLVVAKAYILYDQKNYAASAAAANAVLRVDPKNQDALWLKHASEDRKAPPLRLPGSPWGAEPETPGVAGAVSDDAGKPYTLAVKVRATPAPPDISPALAPNAPRRRESPLVPLAAAGVLLWIGAGIAARQAQERAVDAAGQEGEKGLGKAAGLAERGKELIEHHPYAAGTVVVGAIALGAWLAAPLALGGGGATLLAAGAAGGGVSIAGAAASAVPQVAGAAAVALAVGGDLAGSGKKNAAGTESKSEAAQAGKSETVADLKDFKAYADEESLTHILDGDEKGGGHRPGRGISGKSEFPSDWTDDHIVNSIDDVMSDPSSNVTRQSNGRIAIEGTRDGVKIRVVVEGPSSSDYGRIVTAHPMNMPLNP